jgi:hypothetical protein
MEKLKIHNLKEPFQNSGRSLVEILACLLASWHGPLEFNLVDLGNKETMGSDRPLRNEGKINSIIDILILRPSVRVSFHADAVRSDPSSEMKITGMDRWRGQLLSYFCHLI